jgi:hypothetical protein
MPIRRKDQGAHWFERYADRNEAPMDHRKITNPDELLVLTPEQLFQRLKPLLRKGGLLASTAQLARIKQNLTSISWELAQDWRTTPRLADRKLEFAEYLATRLCNQLRALDRKENPHLYDVHGAYQRDQETGDLDDCDQKYFAFRPVSPPLPPALVTEDWTRSLKEAGQQGAIAQPSIVALVHNIREIETGKTKSPYKLARSQGLSTVDARCQPATGAFTAICDFIDEYTAVPTSFP